MAGGSVKIRIDGDSSGYERTLKSVAQKTKAGLADVKAGIDMASAALTKFANVAKQGVNYNAQIEQLQTSFEVMTGSADKAAETVRRLRTMGAETPFETADLASVTQLLMQYGFTADDALEKMSMLGDIAQGNKQAMVSIATGYAQMSSAGKVNLQDIKQMINGGFNPLQEISERTGESMASLYDRISDGTMAISEITESMKYATSEGGKFYQSMEKQSKTLSGQLSTLKDNANELLGSITSGMSEDLAQSMLPLANEMIGKLQEAFTSGGTDRLISTATDMIPDLLSMMTGKLEEGLSGLAKWAPKGVQALMKAIPGAIKANTSAIPQITSAMFDVASVVVRDLVGMLPELVPELAEGVIGTFESIVTGGLNVVEGLYDGIEQAMHQGQEKIAGVWVDAEKVAKHDLRIDFSLVADTSGAKSKIESAYDEIRSALNTDLLTDAQREEIIGMIGDDYDAIYDKLISFGLKPEESSSIAETISGMGQQFIDGFSELDVGIDSRNLARLALQAYGSRLKLQKILQSEGLSDEDIGKVVAVFDEMNGKLNEQVPSVVQEIYDKLSDGKPDDQQTVETLTGQISGYINGLISKTKTAYENKLAELDPASSDYASKKAEIDEWYASTTAEIQNMDTGMRTLVSTLAGQPTKVVQARIDEFIEWEQRVAALEGKIDAVNEKASTEADRAFNAVRAGAKVSDEQLDLAFSAKISKFAVDKQSAEDAFAAAEKELLDQFNNREISLDEYNAQHEGLEQEKNAAIAAAQQEFEQAFGQIMLGLAKSEGNYDTVVDSMGKSASARMVNALIDSLSPGNVALSNEELTQVSGMLTQLYGDTFTADTILSAVDNPGTLAAMKAALLTAYTDLTGQIDDSVLTGRIGELFSSAIQNDVLVGTTLDVDKDDSAAQLAVLYSTLFSAAAEEAKPGVTASSESLMGSAADAVEDARGDMETSAGYATDGAIDAVNSKKTEMYNAGVALGRELNRGFRSTLEINSPSRVMMRNGEYVGKGLEEGLNASMARAVLVAKQLSGQIVTAADLSQTTRVNMPGLAQEIIVANEQSVTPVNIDGKQIASIQGNNNRVQLAWERARTARGYGYR